MTSFYLILEWKKIDSELINNSMLKAAAVS